VNDDTLIMSGGLVVGGENRLGMVSLNCLDIVVVMFWDVPLLLLLLLTNCIRILCVALDPMHVTDCTYVDCIPQVFTLSKSNW